MQDVQVKRGADAASDHHQLVAEVKIKLLSPKRPCSGHHQYVCRLKDRNASMNSIWCCKIDFRHSTKWCKTTTVHQDDEEDQHQNPQADQPEQ